MLSEEFFKSLPKVELHAHLNGSLSEKALEKLEKLKIKETNGEYKGFTETEREIISMEKPKTMTEVFQIFPIVQSLTESKEALKLATLETLREFETDGVIYLELRSTPKAIGMSKKDLDRRQTFEEAEETMILAINDSTGLIVGIDLSGDPHVDGTKFIPILRKAQENGIKATVHLAEMETCLFEVDEFLDFGPDRIGHGSFLHQRDEWVKKIKRSRIPIEICLTSNIFTKTTSTIGESHFRDWWKIEHPVCLGTDDKGIFPNCSMSGELELAAREFRLSAFDCLEITKTSLKASFLKKTSKEYEFLFTFLNNFVISE
ncbi:unnamed protein product, partial [Mesorhabditis belari]|uniref:Adenosine deaminase domain-containing protein n=1 Tax=Mesorhabditis belari TaxID=2138241 RepID=A0AAF3FHN1_9BILA